MMNTSLLPPLEHAPRGHVALANGRLVDPLRLEAKDLDLGSILVALSHQARFSGHTQRHYSVLQHSIAVSLLCDEGDALAGFAHDFGEAFLPDLPTPLKLHPWMAPWRDAEAANDRVIAQWLGLPSLLPPSVIKADRLALALEARSLLHKDARRFFPAAPDDEEIERWPGGSAALRVLSRPWSPLEALLQGRDRFARVAAGWKAR